MHEKRYSFYSFCHVLLVFFVACIVSSASLCRLAYIPEVVMNRYEMLTLEVLEVAISNFDTAFKRSRIADLLEEFHRINYTTLPLEQFIELTSEILNLAITETIPLLDRCIEMAAIIRETYMNTDYLRS